MTGSEAAFFVLIFLFCWAVNSLVSAIEDYQEMKKALGLKKKTEGQQKTIRF